MKTPINERLQILSKAFPIDKRTSEEKEHFDSFPYNIKNESDEYYDGMLFMLAMIAELYTDPVSIMRISEITLAVCYAWQEKHQEISKKEIEQWELNL